MIGLPAVVGGACPDTSPTAPPSFPGATSVRLTYYDAGTTTLRCDALVPIGESGTVLGVPSPSRPVDLVAEYLDASGNVLGRGETDAITLASGATVDVRVAPSGAFACAPSRATVARAFHSATRLANGDVLFLGGIRPGADATQFLLETRAEIYTPSTGTVRLVTIPDLTPRAFHQAYVLGSGDIAVIGGLTVTGDPTTTPVVVTGGALRLSAGPSAMSAPSQILHLDPATSTFTVTTLDPANDVTPRAFGGLPAPDTPAIAYVGGLDLAMASAPRSSADRVDRSIGLTNQTLATRRPRVGASVTATDAGTLVVWGGDTTSGDGTGTAELGELLTGWDGTPASEPMTFDGASETAPQRAFHGAALAGDGSLIVWGGFRMVTGTAINPVGSVVQRIQSPLSGSIATTLADATTATQGGYGAAVAVGDGDVVMAGGNCGADLACATGEAWRYSTAIGGAITTGPLGVPRYGHALTLLADGTVLASGGLDATPAAVTDLELYEPRGTADDPLGRPAGTVLMPCAVVESPSDAGTD